MSNELSNMPHKPTHHYKDLQEMINSPEYKEYIELIRQGVEAGIIEVYPPLPEKDKTAPF